MGNQEKTEWKTPDGGSPLGLIPEDLGLEESSRVLLGGEVSLCVHGDLLAGGRPPSPGADDLAPWAAFPSGLSHSMPRSSPVTSSPSLCGVPVFPHGPRVQISKFRLVGLPQEPSGRQSPCLHFRILTQKVQVGVQEPAC